LAEQDENGLRGILGKVAIFQLAKARGIDQADILVDENFEGVVGTTARVFLN
jgi:hypothetical protein